MSKYNYCEWREIVQKNLPSLKNPDDSVFHFLSQNIDILSNNENDYISVIVALTSLGLKLAYVDDYVLERFRKINMQGFERYAYVEDEQMKEDLAYIQQLNFRDISDYTRHNNKKMLQQTDHLLEKYYSKEDRMSQNDPVERKRFMRIALVTGIASVMVIGLLVAIGMWNAFVGTVCLVLFCTVLLALGLKNQTTDKDNN